MNNTPVFKCLPPASRASCPLFILLFLSVELAAQDPRQIVEECQKRERVNSMRCEVAATVKGEDGKKAEKGWIIERLGSHGDSKTLITFTAPPKMRGVTLLILNHPDTSSDQWMWTPNTARVRRIPLQDRATRFFGTDFTLEDLDARDLNQFDFTLRGEETVDEALTWRIESKPNRKKISQYSSGFLWIRKDNYALVQYEGLSKSLPVRRLRCRDFQKVQDVWTARQLVMSDFRRKSTTTLRILAVQYNVQLDENRFTVEELERQR